MTTIKIVLKVDYKVFSYFRILSNGKQEDIHGILIENFCQNWPPPTRDMRDLETR